MAPIDRFSLPMLILVLFTDITPITIFFSSVLTSRWSNKLTNVLFFCCFCITGVFSSTLSAEIGTVVNNAFLVVLLCVFYRDGLLRKLLTYGIAMMGINLFSMAVAGILLLFGISNQEFTSHPSSHLATLACVYTFYYPYLYAASKFLRKHIQFSKDMLYFVLIPICEIIMLASLTATALYDTDKTSAIILCAATAVGIASMFFLFLGLKKVTESTKIESRYRWLQVQQKLQAEYYTALEERLHESRKLRHDLINYTQTLDLLMEERQYQEVTDCTQRLRNDLNSQPQFFYCSHPVVNALLFHKFQQALALGIAVDAHLVLRQECGIESADLIGLFANLLDNAIEACTEAEKPTYISLSDRHNDRLYTITLRNSKREGALELVKGKPITKKKDPENHGLGLEILEDIAVRYHGTLTLHDEGNQFTSIVLLQLSDGDEKKENLNMDYNS